MPGPFSKLKERFRSKSHAGATHATQSSTSTRPNLPRPAPASPVAQKTSRITSPTPTKQNAGRTDLWTETYQELPHEDQINLQQLLHKIQVKPQASASTSPHLLLAEDMIDLVIQKRNECEERKWKFTFQGKEIILRDVAEKIVVWFERFKDIGDVVASYDPIHLALPWAGIRFLLQCAVHDAQQMGSLLVAIEKVTYIMNRCAVYEALYVHEPIPGQAFENLKVALKKLYAVILNLLGIMCQTYAESIGQRMVSTVFRPDKFAESLRKCDYSVGIVALEAANCESTHRADNNIQANEKRERLETIVQQMKDPIVRTDNRVAELWENADRSEVAKILQWASQIPYEDNHKTARDGYVSSTGQWLLNHEKYRAWRRSSASTIVWLHGIPGAGKTKLITTVVDDVSQALGSQKNDEAFAYFYCDRNVKDRQDPLAILRSFVRQLSVSRVDQSIQISLIETYRRKQKSGFASEQLDTKECQELLQLYIDLYPQTTIVLDALDECDPQTRGDLIAFLDEAVRLAARPVKIMISSRPDDDIKYRFEKGPNIGIMATDNQDDIAKLIDQRLNEANKGRRDKITPEFQAEITGALLEKSRGMFQWAVLQINHLLELRLEADMRDRLGKLPNDLKQAYDEILERIQSQPGSASKVASMAFRWVMRAQIQIHPRMLVVAACQDAEAEHLGPANVTIDFVLDACKNLLVIDRRLRVCRFAHLSVQEYLETWFVRPIDADYAISRVCIQALMSEYSLDQPHVRYKESNTVRANKASEHNTEDESPPQPKYQYAEYIEILKSETYKRNGLVRLFEYALAGWSSHVRRCEELEDSPDRECLMRALLKFLGTPTCAGEQYKQWHGFVNQDETLFIDIDFDRFLFNWYCEMELSSLPLLAACRLGLYSVLVSWQKSCAMDLTQRNKYGDTLLILAARSGSLQVCRFLVDFGLDVNGKGHNDWFALLCACQGGSREIVELLLDHGADVNLVGGLHETALAAAAARGHKEVVELLLDRGADISLIGGGEDPALVAAAGSGEKEIVEVLLDHGADVNLVGSDNATALAAAGAEGHKEVVELLLDRGADANHVWGYNGNTLIVAASIGYKEIVELLLDHGADVNYRGGYYGTALAAAAKMGRKKVVQLLLDRGAEIDLGGEEGAALADALQTGRDATVHLLIKHYADSECSTDSTPSETDAAQEQGVVDDSDDQGYSDSDLSNDSPP